MKNICQACENAQIEVTEPSDNEKFPYYLCEPCHQRLLQLSLRPREWYNLAKRFGWWQFSLHDDFYDDTGVASQPKSEVVEAKLHQAPILEEVKSDLPALIGYVVSRWHPEKAHFEEFKKFSMQEIKKELRRVWEEAPSEDVAGVCFDICGHVLKNQGADLVRAGWADKGSICFHSLAFATTQCLSYEEGFPLIDGELCAMTLKEKRDRMYVLAYYRSPLILKWVEDNVESPITESWGRLAACSQPDWKCVVSWLEKGRPLSLVALDTIKACIKYDSPLQKDLAPILINPPSDEEMIRVLSDYSGKDPVPRVLQFVEPLTKNIRDLTRHWR